jgi:uncharacterized membrane-anchored protein YhcB (DUF1043 family)
MEKNLKTFGWSLLAAGIIGGLIVGFTMSIQTPGLSEGFTYDDPHPLRWYFGIATMISGAFMGSILIALGELVSTQNYRTRQINELNRKIQRNTAS